MDPSPKKVNQLRLLFKKRFAGFFWTQFLTAFNDNVYKNALIIYVSFYSLDNLYFNPNTLINLGAGLFILPFFLFSAFSGQLSDKYEKSGLIRKVKIGEMCIMALVCIGFLIGSLTLLYAVLFLTGMQSTFFSPAKYSIIPQHLNDDELVGGNALVEMGTFAAILFGTMTGGILIQTHHGKTALSIGVFLIALIGWLTSLTIPKASPADPNLKFQWNLIKQSVNTIGFAKRDPTIYRCVWGISWFWFLGGAFLTQIPNYTRTVLMGDESVATFCLTLFSLGIGVGSLLCEKLSNHRVDLGLTTFGVLGLCIFGTDIAFAYTAPGDQVMSLLAFLRSDGSFRIVFDFFMYSVFGGFYIVPLYAYIQRNTPFEIRSRVIAATNIYNAMLMVSAAVLGMIYLGYLDHSIPSFFLLLSGLSVLFFSFLFYMEPGFVIAFRDWVKNKLGKK
ncbi:MAG: phospholipid/glycerol acyltransferase [Candidatus Magnetoglobus multicellularis str. Araruama]|uniref:Phospholipid/glycerol acyltransferase n=1 Tax=Candidatus Magnetoglobus multicellularis str. Araruama TaxID=890399 RepID=A0A1V1P2P8_9BACT|nr:MAG: phospholipid/glycerol acyltransferase [Candidatus Magnetoglobus multicellularis str. Araruama]